MLNNENDDYEFKSSYINGNLSREEFWSVINSSLNDARKLQHLLLKDQVSIEIFCDYLVVKYQLRNNELLSLVIPKNDLRTASFTILANGNYESLLEDVIFELASSSNKFLDIGANIGFYSVGACLMKKNLKVLAFEPNPNIRKSFIQNTELNFVTNNIEVSDFALSNFTGDATFSVPAFTGSGGGSLMNLHPEEGSPEEFSVKVEKLDNLRSQTLGANLFKIDVEGAEFQLLQGAIETIEEEHPTIIVELLRKWMRPFQSSPQDVVDLLTRLGYLCFAVGESKLQQIDLIDESTSETNFVFCHSENVKHLKLLKNIHREN